MAGYNPSERRDEMSASGEKCSDLLTLHSGDNYYANDECYVITEDHSISDVVRWLISQCDAEEVKMLVDCESKSNLEKELKETEKKRDEIIEQLLKL